MKDDRKLPDLAILDFFQPEIVDVLIDDMRHGRTLTEYAATGGCAFFPISRHGFLVAAPYLEVHPDFAYFHIELSDFHLENYGQYTGGMFCVCDPKRITPEALIERFHFAGLLTTVKEAQDNLEGCILAESPAARTGAAGLLN